jgi:hypothetical protein
MKLRYVVDENEFKVKLVLERCVRLGFEEVDILLHPIELREVSW